MGLHASSLYEHIGQQLRKLCDTVGLPNTNTPLALLRDLLGPSAARSLAEPPLWPSNVADDHTPVEFSVALDEAKPPALRILAETVADRPSKASNLQAARALLNSLADRFSISLDSLRRVQDLFLTSDHQGRFSLWYSLIFRSGTTPDTKIYFNPDVRGRHRAPELVAEALRRLNLRGAYQTIVDHAVRPGQLGTRDRFAFFALDLHDRPHSRVKVYLSHDGAEARDVGRAARAVGGVDVDHVTRFCAVAGGTTGSFDGLPLISSYSFVETDTDRPSGYSLYLPIRDYVNDDEEARHRVLALLAGYGLDTVLIDRAIAAVARRPLRDGVGLIAHVSLRLGNGRPGATVYLSSEAYAVRPARPAARTEGGATGNALDPVQ